MQKTDAATQIPLVTMCVSSRSVEFSACKTIKESCSTAPGVRLIALCTKLFLGLVVLMPF